MFSQDELINDPSFQGLSKPEQDTVLAKYSGRQPVSWDAIQSSPDFQGLSGEDQAKVTQKYTSQYGPLPEPPRSAVGEIFTGLKKGALTAESMAGQSLQYLSSPGHKTYEVGSGLVQSAQETEAKNPQRYTTRPKQHGAVVNALASGAEMIIPSMALPLAAGAVIEAAPVEVPAAIAMGLSSLTAVIPFALSQGQQTYENVKKSGGTEEEATKAGRINAFIEGAGEEVAGLFELRFLGKALKAFGAGKVIGDTAGNILEKIAKPRAMREFLKDALRTQAVEVGTEFGQNYGEAKVEKAYGVKSQQTSFQQGLSVIPATIGMTTLLLPFGGLAAAKNFSENRKIVHAVEDPSAPEAHRLAAATYVAAQIKEVDKQASSKWAASAAQAIAEKKPISIGTPIEQTESQVRESALQKTRDSASDTELKTLKSNPSVLAKYGMTPEDIDRIQRERMGPISKAIETSGAELGQNINTASNVVAGNELINDFINTQQGVQDQANIRARALKFERLKKGQKESPGVTENDNQSKERVVGKEFGWEKPWRPLSNTEKSAKKAGTSGAIQENVKTPQIAVSEYNKSNNTKLVFDGTQKVKGKILYQFTDKDKTSPSFGGTFLTDNLDNIKEKHQEQIGKFTKKPATANKNASVPERLAAAIGDQELAKNAALVSNNEEQQIKQIVNDSVKQKVDLATQLRKSGHDVIAEKYQNDAEENARKLKNADGVITENAVNKALGVKETKNKGKSLQYQVFPHPVNDNMILVKGNQGKIRAMLKSKGFKGIGLINKKLGALVFNAKHKTAIESALAPGTKLLVRQGTPEPGTKLSVRQGTPGDIRSELIKKHGKRLVTTLEKKGLLNIVSREGARKILNIKDADNKVEGFTLGGKVYLVKGNIDKGQATTVLAHELGSHLYLENAFSGKNWDQIKKTFRELENSKTKTGEAIRRAIDRVPGNTANADAEKIAYYIGDNANRGQLLYRRIIAHVKNALVKLGVPASILSPADLSVIAESGIRRIVSGKEDNVKFSKSSKIAESIEKIIAPVYYDPVSGTIDTAMINLRKAKVFAKDFSTFDTIFKTAEHYYHKIPAAKRYLEIVLNRRDKFENLRNSIIGDFPSLGKKLQKDNPFRYNAVSDYLDKRDRFRYGYRITSSDEKFTIHVPGKTLLFNNDKIGLKESKTFDTEQEAIDFMINQEAADYMKSNPAATKEEVALLMDTRRATNEGFNLLSQQLRDRIEKAKKANEDIPKINIKNKEGETKQVNLREVLDEIGELRGSYLPRIRKRGGYTLIAERKNKNGDKEHFSQNYDVYLRNYSADGDVKTILKNMLNKATPIAREARKLEAQGYKIKSIKLNKNMPEEIFKPAALAVSVENMIKAGVQRAEGVEGGILGEELDKSINDSVADIFRMRGFRSVMMKRNALYGDWVYKGYEPDLVKRIVQYSNNTAAGIAKRDMARGMIMAITGRDITWADYKKNNPGEKYVDYQRFVRKRGIDPVKQKTAFTDIMGHMDEMLRNDEAIDRIVSTAKGLASLKYLGFRVSSAFINVTNMVMNVPAAMVAIGHIPYLKTFILIGRGMKDYSKWRIGKGKISEENRAALDYIHDRNWDEALFNKDAYTSLLNNLEGKWHNFTTWSMWLFGETERLNRGSTILAAYNGIKPSPEWNGSGIDIERMKLAHHISDMAHGIYDKATRPAITRGSGLGPAALRASYTFMKFQHSFLQLLGAVSPAGHIENKTAFAHLLISPAIIGGAGASLLLPVLVEISRALGIGGDDPEEEFYKWADKTFNGEDFARFGIPGLAGVSIKGSLAINGPPNTLAGIIGATYSVFADEYEAASLLARGDIMKALEKALPTGLGAPIRAYREATEGVTSKSNMPLFYGQTPVKDSPVEAMWRFFAFAPARISKIREKQWNEKVVLRRYAARKKEIYNKYRKILLDGGSASDLGKVFKEIEEFNLKVMQSKRPDIRMITRATLNSALRKMYIPPKRERERAKEM